jgi:hypothetical protein
MAKTVVNLCHDYGTPAFLGHLSKLYFNWQNLSFCTIVMPPLIAYATMVSATLNNMILFV